MSGPTPAGDPAALTALTDPENMGWVEQAEPLTEEQAYWRARGMIPPADTELVE